MAIHREALVVLGLGDQGTFWRVLEKRFTPEKINDELTNTIWHKVAEINANSGQAAEHTSLVSAEKAGANVSVINNVFCDIIQNSNIMCEYTL